MTFRTSTPAVAKASARSHRSALREGGHIVAGCLAALVVAGSLAPERPAAQAAQGTAVTALTGVRIIDGTGRPPIERGTVIISNGRITAAGASIQIPAGATSVDL